MQKNCGYQSSPPVGITREGMAEGPSEQDRLQPRRGLCQRPGAKGLNSMNPPSLRKQTTWAALCWAKRLELHSWAGSRGTAGSRTDPSDEHSVKATSQNTVSGLTVIRHSAGGGRRACGENLQRQQRHTDPPGLCGRLCEPCKPFGYDRWLGTSAACFGLSNVWRPHKDQRKSSKQVYQTQVWLRKWIDPCGLH